MKLANKWTSELLGKDRKKYDTAAIHIANTPDIEAWNCLIENSEYIFAFIKEKAIKSITRQFNQNNFQNIFSFFHNYSTEYDDCLVEKLSTYADKDLNIKMLKLLKSASDDEKAYAAKYFSYINFEPASEDLINNLQNDNEYIKVNSAQALGFMKNQAAYEYLLEKIKDADDWIKVDSAQLLAAYNNKNALLSMLEAMNLCAMPEHIAGEIASLITLPELLESEDPTISIFAPDVIKNIIDSIPEVWPIESIVDFKFYEICEKLLHLIYENSDEKLAIKYALLILQIKAKIALFATDSQYTFDQDKYVVNELEEINQFLLSISVDFWNDQLNILYKQLYCNDEKLILSIFNIIKDLKPDNILPHILEIIYENDQNDVLLCEAILVMKELDLIGYIDDKQALLSTIKDKNMLAVVENALNI